MAEHMTVCGGHLTAGETASQIFSHAKVDKDLSFIKFIFYKIFDSSNIQYSHMPRWLKYKIFDNSNIQLSCFKNAFGICQKMETCPLHFVVILKKQRQFIPPRKILILIQFLNDDAPP